MSAPSPLAPRLAMIGITGYGGIYLDLLRGVASRVHLAALTVLPVEAHLPVVEELRQTGIRIYHDYQSMLAAEHGQIDLCLIPTPIHCHAPMAEAALAAGAHVLVEKPLAGGLAAARRVVQAEATHGLWVAVGFQDLYTTEVAWLKQRLADGAIGTIRRITALGIWPRGRSYYTRNGWAGRRTVDGASVQDHPFNNAFAHFINLALFLGGETPTTSANPLIEEAHLRRAHTIETFDTGVVRARTAAGQRFWFGFSHNGEADLVPEIVIEGSAGEARWVLQDEATISPIDGPVERRLVPDYAATRGSMMEAVLARLQDGVTPICSTTIALAHTTLVDAVDRLAEPLPFPEGLLVWHRQIGPEREVPVVPGLEAILRAARATDTTPDWPAPARRSHAAS